MAWTAGRALSGVTDQTLADLAAILADLEDPDASADDLRTRDLDFFLTLVSMTGNRVLLLIANAIRHVYQERPTLFLPIHQPGGFDTRHHRRVIDALSRGDGAAASAAMEAFARSARRLLGEDGTLP